MPLEKESWSNCIRGGEGSAHFTTRYRVILVVSELGWVDLDLRCSLGWWAATKATYCPGRMVKDLKMKSTQM